MRIAQRNEAIIVAVEVKQGGGLGRNFDFEHPHVLIFEGEMVRRLGSDHHDWALGERDDRKQQKKKRNKTSHGGGF